MSGTADRIPIRIIFQWERKLARVGVFIPLELVIFQTSLRAVCKTLTNIATLFLLGNLTQECLLQWFLNYLSSRAKFQLLTVVSTWKYNLY